MGSGCSQAGCLLHCPHALPATGHRALAAHRCPSASMPGDKLKSPPVTQAHAALLDTAAPHPNPQSPSFHPPRRLQVRAATTPRTEPTTLVTLRALLLAGAFPLIPPEKVPKNTRIGALYGEFTPVTLLQELGGAAGQAVQLGSAAFKAAASKVAGAVGAVVGGGGSSEGAEGTADAAGADGIRPGATAVPVAPSPTATAASAAAKPRRQPPPPPPKM